MKNLLVRNNKITSGSILIWLIFSLITIMLGYHSYIEKYEKKWLSIGGSFLVINGDHLDMDFIQPIKSAQIFFDNQLEEAFTGITGSESSVMFSANNMWIKIDGPNLFKGKVAIQISDPNTAFSKNRITKVKINDVNVSINEFVNDYISLDSAQTTVRNKLSIRNMSYLYTYLGVYIPTIIIWFLVPLSIIQSFLIFVFILNRLPESLSKLIPIVHQEDTKIFDYLTENFSIPLGLFGTIASVWTSFQLVSINLGDITAVIELISIGMFTTFLGMYCYSLLLVRHAWGNAIEK